MQDRALRPDERRLTDEQLVDDHPERVEIGGGRERLPGDLLGRHIGRRAGQHRAGEVGRIGGAGQPEVEQAQMAVLGDEHVRRLEIAVDDPGRVQTLERV